MKNIMGCSGCKKKTYFDRAKEIDRKTSIAMTVGIIIIVLAGYGLWELISNIKW